ncbi:MAG: response regulator [Bacteroidetes bacterium]|nr:response regulator [Bacteroidota bacterium]
MENPYRVVIVDDEPPARDLIAAFVGRVPDLLTVAVCSNALDALAAIQRHKAELVFVDIQMPEMTGMDLMALPLTDRPEFVLTTAYSHYAAQSYEVAALDYLVKPIAFERFMQAVARFKEKRGRAREVEGKVPDAPPAGEELVWLREEKKLLQIPYQEVLYLEASKDYVKVFLPDQMILTHLSLAKAAELFRPPEFIPIHRSYLVRRAAIRLIEGNRLLLTNGKELSIGPSYRESLKKYIKLLP